MAWDLSIDRIIGTSATTNAQWAIQGTQIAYTACNGVVVASYNESKHRLENQRFFCANNSLASPGSEYQLDSEESTRDSFGYTLGEPIIVRNREEDEVSGDVTTLTPLSGGTPTSPSKFKKSRNITCVALSPNGRLLAVGESGYQPRILIYSLAPDLGSSPVMQVFEHSFGILNITFSPDLRHLVSLGVVSDGFINVWKIGSTISLLSLNKCTSLVNQIIWQGPNSFVTIGLRFIKVWLMEGNKVLKGRNAILGPMINSNFISGHALDEAALIILTSENQLVYLDLSDTVLKFVDYEVDDSTSITGDSSTLWILSRDGDITLSPISELQICDDIPKPQRGGVCSSPLKIGVMKGQADPVPEIVNILNMDDGNLALLTGTKGIKLFNKDSKVLSDLTSPVVPNLAGLDQVQGASRILVLSKTGEIKLINTENRDLQVSDIYNLKDEVVNPNGIAFISEEEFTVGDIEGNLYFYRSIEGKYALKQQLRAHSSAVNEIAFMEIESSPVVISIARDRMIQIFVRANDEWELLQTLNLHNGNLTQLEVDSKNSRIYVGSLDRSLSIHSISRDENQELAVKLDKLISLRTAPIALKLTHQDVIVSTNDRTLQIYSKKTGDYKRTLKLFHEKDSLLVEEILLLDPQIIVSSSDKSVRVFNYSLGRPILTLWGQLDLKLFQNGNCSLLGLSSEGCIISYNFEADETDEPVVATKVARKIAAPVRKLTNTSIASSDSSSGSITLTEKSSPSLPAPGSKKTTPTSSPRLTGATIRRLEARGISPSSLVSGSSIGLGSLKSSSRLSSPIKPQLGTPSLKSLIKDKPILRSPGKQAIIPLSPVSSGSPNASRRLSSPSKTPLSTSTVDRLNSSAHRNIPARPASSSPSRAGSRGISTNKTLLPVSRYLDVLDKIVESLGRGEISDQDIPLFAQKIEHIRTILDIYDTDGSDIEQPDTKHNGNNNSNSDSSGNFNSRLLEDYSDKLLELVKTKLDDLELKNSLGPD